MNAKAFGSLAAAVLLAGCTARVSFEPHEDQGTELVSRHPASAGQPDFGSQPKPVEIGGPGSSAQHSSLVSLFGELEDEWISAGEPYDGSSNVTQITFATEGACSDPDVNREGTRMVFASTQHSTTADIYIKPLPGRTLTQLTTDPAEDVMPAFHPDGDRIAFTSNRAGNWDIYVISLQGGQPMKVTDDVEHEMHPSWSPDGEHLIYCKLGAKSGRWEMWVVDMDNPGVRRFLDYGLFPQWCPDVVQSKILFQRARQRGSRYFSIWTLDYVNGNAVRPTEIVSAGNAAVINPAWSPAGDRIVFVTVVEPQGSEEGEAPEQSDVWIVGLDGSGRTNLTNGRYTNYQPAWAGDGRVYFVSNRTGTDNIWSVTTSRVMQAAAPGYPRVTSGEPGYETDERVVGQP